MSKIIRLVPAAVLSALLFQACEVDHGLGLSPSRITGKVIHIQKPANVDSIAEDVRVVAAAKFPPTGVADVFFSNEVRTDRDTADFEIIVPYGTYPAIAVLWKQSGRNWALESLLGFYGFDLPNFQASLKGVELTEENPVAVNVDMYALWDFAQFDARVEGVLTYVGNWPDDTKYVALFSYPRVPDLQNPGSLLAFSGLNFTLPRDSVSTYAYEMPVRNGEHQFIGFFWVGQDVALDKIRCLGFYPAPDDSSRPGVVTVGRNGLVRDINITVDFNSLPDGVKIGGGR